MNTQPPSIKSKKKKEHKPQRKKPSRPCPFCGKTQYQLKRHLLLKHNDKNEIQSILKMGKREQYKAINALRKKGMFDANITALASTCPQLHCEKRGKQERGINDLSVCITCNTYVVKANFHRHKKICLHSKAARSTPVTLLAGEQAKDKLSAEVLHRFRQNNVGDLCRNDALIKLLGKQSYQKACSRGPKKTDGRKCTMRDMRTLAQLFINLQNATINANLEYIPTSAASIFELKYFEHLEVAISEMCTKQNGDSKNALKLHIGYLLKTTSGILQANYLLNRQKEKLEEVKEFDILLKYKWRELFGGAEYASVARRQEKLRRPHQLPMETDMTIIRDYTLHELARLTTTKTISTSDYVKLRALACSRLTLFNARRGGEPARLTLAEWHDAKSGAWISRNDVNQLDDISKSIIDRLKICFQSGKGVGKLVPIDITRDVEPALCILADPAVRASVGVWEKNIFLFANIASDDHTCGTNDIKRICEEAGVQGHVTATAARHRASTIYAGLDLPEGQRQLWYDHEGHSEQINKSIYQCPRAIQELTRVGPFLEMIDGNCPSTSIGSSNNY